MHFHNVCVDTSCARKEDSNEDIHTNAGTTPHQNSHTRPAPALIDTKCKKSRKSRIHAVPKTYALCLSSISGLFHSVSLDTFRHKMHEITQNTHLFYTKTCALCLSSYRNHPTESAVILSAMECCKSLARWLVCIDPPCAVLGHIQRTSQTFP